MEKISSENYDFYFLKNSIAERDINQIIEIQENCFKEICTFLDIHPSIRIKYYLVDSPERVGEIYGDYESCDGFACPPDEVYAVYNEKIKCIGPHEDTHILSFTINKPKSSFIREGLAMFFDKVWWDKDNDDWVRLFLKEKRYVNIEQLLSEENFIKYSDSLTYPIAGSFTKFILGNYGVEKYIYLYKHTEDGFNNKIKEVYMKDVDELEKEFILSILNSQETSRDK